MYYFIDGYNFLFHFLDERKSLLKRRTDLILFLQKSFSEKNLRGQIVFDGKVRLDEESGRAYPSPLELIYTSFEESADRYIVESVELLKLKNEITVVTNDRGLRKELAYLHVKLSTNDDFFHFLSQKKRRKEEEKEDWRETPLGMKRLQKIFEEKLSEN